MLANRIENWLETALARKREIDQQNQTQNNMRSYDHWLVDAVELLLLIELERRQ